MNTLSILASLVGKKCILVVDQDNRLNKLWGIKYQYRSSIRYPSVCHG
jgi:hypothetical protein